MPDRVILLHGFGGLSIQFLPLSRHLRRSGFEPRSIGYPSWRWPIERIVDHLLAQLDGEDDRPCHSVAHSMGGLVLRSLLT